LTAEEDPVFNAHTVSGIVDGEGFLRQDSANNWYWDANTYITANDIPSTTATLDEVTSNGNQTTNGAEFGALTVDGNNVIVEGSNNALLSNGSNYITLLDLSASGDLTYDNETGVFTANLQSTGITTNDLSVTQQTASGTGTLVYDDTNGEFTCTPPDTQHPLSFHQQPKAMPQILNFVISSPTECQVVRQVKQVMAGWATLESCTPLTLLTSFFYYTNSSAACTPRKGGVNMNIS